MKVIKIFFNIYRFFSSPVATCRFQPTCSQYSEEAIQKYGLLKGAILSIKRILSCHPFSTRPVVDPIP